MDRYGKRRAHPAVVAIAVFSLVTTSGCAHPEFEKDTASLTEEWLTDNEETADKPSSPEIAPEIATSEEPPQEQIEIAETDPAASPAEVLSEPAVVNNESTELGQEPLALSEKTATGQEPVAQTEPEADDRPLPALTEQATLPSEAVETSSLIAEKEPAIEKFEPTQNPGRFARLTKECSTYDEPTESANSAKPMAAGRRLWTEKVPGGEWRKVYRRTGLAYIKNDCFTAAPVKEPVVENARPVVEKTAVETSSPTVEPVAATAVVEEPRVQEPPPPPPPPVASVEPETKKDPAPPRQTVAVNEVKASRDDDGWLMMAAIAVIFSALGFAARHVFQRPRKIRGEATMTMV